MSQAVIHGDTIYLAGQVADRVKDKSVGEQTKDVLATIDRARRGGLRQDENFVGDRLSRIDAFAEMNAQWDAWVPAGHAPARSTVEAKLAAAVYGVEIACIAGKA